MGNNYLKELKHPKHKEIKVKTNEPLPPRLSPPVSKEPETKTQKFSTKTTKSVTRKKDPEKEPPQGKRFGLETESQAYIAVCEKIGKNIHSCVIPLIGIEMKKRTKIQLLSEFWTRKWPKPQKKQDPKDLREQEKDNNSMYFEQVTKCSKVAVYRIAYSRHELDLLLRRSISSPITGPTLVVVQQVPEEIDLLTVNLCPRIFPLMFEVIIHSVSFPQRVSLQEPCIDFLDQLFGIFKENYQGTEWERESVCKFPVFISSLI
jgi:hypothetical protein